MADRFEKGDRVEWNTSQGKTRGVVITKLVNDTEIKGHKVRASDAEPQYMVESEKTGERAAHKPESLSKVGE